MPENSTSSSSSSKSLKDHIIDSFIVREFPTLFGFCHHPIFQSKIKRIFPFPKKRVKKQKTQTTTYNFWSFYMFFFSSPKNTQIPQETVFSQASFFEGSRPFKQEYYGGYLLHNQPFFLLFCVPWKAKKHSHTNRPSNSKKYRIMTICFPGTTKTSRLKRLTAKKKQALHLVRNL